MFASLLFFTTSALAYADTTIDPDEFLERYRASISRIDDYQCRISQWSLKDGELDKKIMNFYYRSPEQIRIDVVEGNRGVGSTGVLRPEGKIAASPSIGPIRLRFVFDIHHPVVTTNRGRTFIDAALSEIFDKLSDRVELCSVRVTRIENRIEVENNRCDDDQGDVREIITFDADTLLPLQNDTFVDGAHVEHIEWTNFNVNRNIPEEIFDISVREKKLKRIDGVILASTPVSDYEMTIIDAPLSQSSRKP